MGAHPFREALIADGIQVNSFGVEGIPAECKRRTTVGVRSVQERTAMGPGTSPMLDDMGGNLRQNAALNVLEIVGQ